MSFEKTFLHHCQFASESNHVKFPAIVWTILCVGNYWLPFEAPSKITRDNNQEERKKKEQGLENKHVQSILPFHTGLHTPTLSQIPPPFLNAPLTTNRELEHYS